ncbi:hypothetical protein AJ85_07975 [Alkalihalobacillus alcalophilus ATCC 27647 = CGMCC 1.3604]|uniref:Glycerophosphodiester phosphodiesterase n=1 Tax=Alkalihalobacillus alcalophilus ATCC 27647 = CGMCC 1.3604 TaxID=1218173 RepID=A0A094YR65_ALKAL|nr:glycerophosphodiester phosphodiesterase [Alkalihalobacillus alcalophilus]KGA95967.1 glycerophosphodiester phosphodiesterase [Alkalihalobacillus alcalophilus ATCC 27647 = CGMCC 1.3604]MED1561913.1 glycerophosphodiester phosphodiesterase [Alkalihalobacillus alcalophilus]THG90953.1 hypothetical protein AJ85_07975 [Alkalihalobacillus alcalophilus ATCC 27647 = CGMCC 1.3604]
MIYNEIFAHRGFSSKYPENTMSAFKAAAELDIDGIELDVQLTKDGVLVIMHDLKLDRTTNGKGFVRQTSSYEIQTLSAGAWFSDEFEKERVPTLEEFFQWVKPLSLKINIELKGLVEDREQLIEKVLNLVRSYSLEERVIFSSFDHRGMKMLKNRAPEIESAVIAMAAIFGPEHYATTVGVEGYHFYSPTLLEEEAKKLIRSEFLIRPFTVNREEDLKKFMSWGVAGLFTDNPDLAVKVRESLKKGK